MPFSKETVMQKCECLGLVFLFHQKSLRNEVHLFRKITLQQANASLEHLKSYFLEQSSSCQEKTHFIVKMELVEGPRDTDIDNK